MTTKIWTKEEIKKLILENDEMVRRSVLKLYSCQTAEEKANGSTEDYNGVGFNLYDASFLTSIAEQLTSGHNLSRKQIEITRKKLVKYSKQLTDLANDGV